MEDATGTPSAGFFQKISLFGILVLIVSLGTPQIRFLFAGQNVVATDLIFLAVAAFWLLSLLFRGGRFRWSIYYIFLTTYLFSLLLSICFSKDSHTSVAKFPAEIYLGAISVLVLNIVDDEAKLRKAVLAWLGGTAFAVCLGVATIFLYYLSPQNWLLEYLTYHYGAVPVGNYPRITATFVSASMFCNYLNVSMALAVGTWAKGWVAERTALIMLLGIVACSIFTISIGLGGIFLAISLAVVTYRSESRVLRWVAFASVLLAAGSLLLSIFALSPYPGGQPIAVIPMIDFPLIPSSRWLVWSDALRTFLNSPITGVGLGLPTANVLFANSEGTNSVLMDAHNSFLNVAAESGVVGLAAFLALAAYPVRLAFRSFAEARAFGVTKAAGIGFVCAFIYQGLTGSFEEARHLWVLIGLLLAAYGVEQSEVKIPEQL